MPEFLRKCFLALKEPEGGFFVGGFFERVGLALNTGKMLDKVTARLEAVKFLEVPLAAGEASDVIPSVAVLGFSPGLFGFLGVNDCLVYSVFHGVLGWLLGWLGVDESVH